MALDITTRLLSRFGTGTFLTDGSLECAMTDKGFDLPDQAAFPLLARGEGRAELRRYFTGFLDEAEALGLGFVLDTVTWRASVGWGARLGFSGEAVDAVNIEAVAFAKSLRLGRAEVMVNGVIGPCGGTPDCLARAKAYHARQIGLLAEAGVDLITARSLTHPIEAVGIAQAAQQMGVPLVLSFALQGDGRLACGTTLAAAIAEVDDASQGFALCYGIDGAHPEDFVTELAGPAAARIGMVRANAFPARTERQAGQGDPVGLSQDMARLLQMAPHLHVMGGGTGTGLAHVAAIGQRIAARLRDAAA